MNLVPVGTSLEKSILVTPEVTIDFLGGDETRVLSTPHLIGYLEYTCRDAAKPFLSEGYDTVGTVVTVRHLAATPVGLSVRFVATVTETDGNRVVFQVEAWDEKEKVADGTHERFIIHIPRFVARLASKQTTP
jgi:fluoroacetyl-CoA thioesterase